MPQINVGLGRFTTGGPFSYTIYRNGIGSKSVTGLTTLALAWDAIRNDVAALLGTETVISVNINVQSN